MAKHPLKKDELQEAFTMKCSPDNTLPLDKLASVIRCIGHAPTEAKIAELIREFQSKGVRALTYQQVEDIINKYGFFPESAEEIRDSFRMFDKDGTGVFSAGDLRHVLCSLGEKLPAEDVDELIRVADITGQGFVNCDEVVKMITSGY